MESMNHPSSESYEEEERTDLNKQLIIGDSSMNKNLPFTFARAKSPINAFENHSVDPFDTLPAPFSKAVDLLTKYCTHPIERDISFFDRTNDLTTPLC